MPDIADLPTVSNGGRTYTFHIRKGYRFSPPSGAPVTADVMRYSIERAISPKITDPAAQGFNMIQDIVGFDAYRSGKADHVSGIRASGDALSFTLTAPAADFLARISLPFFSAVPLGTPALPHGVDRPIPSAGPYYVVGPRRRPRRGRQAEPELHRAAAARARRLRGRERRGRRRRRSSRHRRQGRLRVCGAGSISRRPRCRPRSSHAGTAKGALPRKPGISATSTRRSVEFSRSCSTHSRKRSPTRPCGVRSTSPSTASVWPHSRRRIRTRA